MHGEVPADYCIGRSHSRVASSDEKENPHALYLFCFAATSP